MKDKAWWATIELMASKLWSKGPAVGHRVTPRLLKRRPKGTLYDTPAISPGQLFPLWPFSSYSHELLLSAFLLFPVLRGPAPDGFKRTPCAPLPMKTIPSVGFNIPRELLLAIRQSNLQRVEHLAGGLSSALRQQREKSEESREPGRVGFNLGLVEVSNMFWLFEEMIFCEKSIVWKKIKSNWW